MALWQKTLWAVCLLAVMLPIAGWLYETWGAQRDATAHPPPGRLISIGSRKLHILCRGTLGPAVVIEQGAGELSRSWWPVQERVAPFARICTYDRAGFAWSEPAYGARSIDDRVADLRALLRGAGIAPPYILVAHSYGGLIVRRFQHAHPDEVAGLVLVDTPEESSIFQPQVLDFYDKARVMNRVIGVAARFGVLRVLRHWLPLEKYGLWLSSAAEYAALCDDLASLRAVPASLQHSEPPGSLGGLPVTVITHGQAFPGPFAILETNWDQGQHRLAALSSAGRLIVAANSNHMIQHDEPDIVVDAIRTMHATVTVSSSPTLAEDEGNFGSAVHPPARQNPKRHDLAVDPAGW
jgi:pimeloyl-ACP methyl ester carboxylesterase